jgi:hypothetical protein
MAIVKSAENGRAPAEGFTEAMAKFREESIKEGVLIDGSRLLPSEAGARLRLASGKLTVTDGPFIESKEVVGGYGVYEFKSKRDATYLMTRFMHLLAEHWPGWEGETEIRQLSDERCTDRKET